VSNFLARSGWRQAAAALVLASASAGAQADQFGLQLGAGFADHGIDKGDLAAVWDPHVTWWDTGTWHFALLGEFHVAQWHTGQGNINSNLTELGVNPVVRLVKNGGDVRPYFEIGAGLRGLTHAVISTNYSLSTAFQFTEFVGVGLAFGQRQQYQVGYRFQHVSNGGIKEPNPGVDFHEIYAQYNF
jgi:lipid A 3-O-deacylase